MSGQRELYFCCPSLNTECTKEGCFIHGGPCQSTTDWKYARCDPYGNLLTSDGEEFDQNDSELEGKI